MLYGAFNGIIIITMVLNVTEDAMNVFVFGLGVVVVSSNYW